MRIPLEPRPLAAAGAVDDARPDRWGERVIRYVDHAPAYVAPTASGQGYRTSSAPCWACAEFGIGEAGGEASLTNAMSACTRFGLDPAEAARHIQQVIAVVEPWRDHFMARGVSATDIEQLAERIHGSELLAQRRDFKAPTSRPPTRKRPQNPFAPKS